MMSNAEKSPEKTGDSASSQAPSSASPSITGGGRAVQLKAALRGQDYATQVQMLAPDAGASGGQGPSVKEAASRGMAGSGGALPHADRIQKSFGGYDILNVQAYTDAHAREGSAMMGASAYATGNNVVLGQGGTDLHTVAHEAAHVVQQRAGVSLSGGVGKAGDPYERHADAVADLVVQGKSAEGLLGEMAGGGGGVVSGAVQKQDADSAEDKDDLIDVAARFVAWDPPVMRVIGEIVGVSGEPPTPAFVEALRQWQSSSDARRPGMSRTVRPTGELDGATVEALAVVRLAQLEETTAGDRSALQALTQACPLLQRNARVLGNRISDHSGGRQGDTGRGSSRLLQSFVFLGRDVDGKLHGELAERLVKAEQHLQAQLEEVRRNPEANSVLAAKGITSTDGPALGKWLGIRQNHTGWRPGAGQGYHRYGLAIDINRDLNAWHPVRTGTRIGGEGTGGGGFAAFDKEALVIIDRANLFMRKARAELRAVDRGLSSRPGEASAVALSSGLASQAVADYFKLVFKGDDALLAWNRSARDAVRIPTNLTELPESEAIANIEGVIARVHGGTWPRTAPMMRDMIRQDLFPLARQMAKGSMSKDPKETKNPLHGFFNVDARLAGALSEQAGLSWGACELGASSSGDAMHFDLGHVPTEALGTFTPDPRARQAK